MPIPQESSPTLAGDSTLSPGTATAKPQLPPRVAEWVCLCVILLLTAALRFRLLDIPLERDEGEFAYGGQLLLQGIPPFRDLYAMKLPGIYAAYAVVLAVFGQTAVAVHIGLLLVNSVTIVLIFFLVRRLFDPFAAIISSVAYALLSVSPSVLGLAAHATHFIMLFALGGTLLLLRSLHGSRPYLGIAASGLLFGLAFLMKQSGGAFFIFGLLLLCADGLRTNPMNWRVVAARICLFSGVAALPVMVTWVLLAQAHVLTKSLFWNFDYSREYATLVSPSKGVQIFLGQFSSIIAGSPEFWLIAALGLITLLLDKHMRSRALFLLVFALCSALAVIPGFYFRSHYFVQFLPAAALLVGGFFYTVMRHIKTPYGPKAATLAAGVLVAGIVAHDLFAQRQILFVSTPVQASRAIYGTNPFPESIPISQYINEHCPASERIAILGSEPQIYFLSHRLSATGHIYMYPLMEPQKYALPMQRELIREVEAARPEYLIFVREPFSWLRTPNSQPLIFSWFESYRRQYDLVGVADIVSPDHTEYVWGAEAARYVPRGHHYIWVLRRKGSSASQAQRAE